MKQFDVFLAHNSLDKPDVKVIAAALRRRNLKPWIDDEQIPPGKSFQDEIQQAIPLVKSAAIFIGVRGLGRWQVLELKSLISQCVNRNIPVIPVLLLGVNQVPDELIFLAEFRWVSFSQGIDDEDALSLLVWGITQESIHQQQSPTTPIKPDSSFPSLSVFQFDPVKLSVATNGVITNNFSICQANYFVENLDGVRLEMVEIPSGTFFMGAAENEEESMNYERPRHSVTVPRFFMGKYAITQKQWEKVANSFGCGSFKKTVY